MLSLSKDDRGQGLKAFSLARWIESEHETGAVAMVTKLYSYDTRRCT